MTSRIAIFLFAGAVSALCQPPNIPWLNEDFGQETQLNAEIWDTNVSTGSDIGGANKVVPAHLEFSSEGLHMTGAGGRQETTAIRLRRGLSAPFIVHVRAMAIAGTAVPFALYLQSQVSHEKLIVFGNPGAGAGPAHRLAVIFASQPAVVLDGNPSLHKWYTITVQTGPAGNASVTLSDEGGAEIGKAGGFKLGTGYVSLYLGQFQGPSPAVQVNEAVWRSVEVTNDAANATSNAAPGSQPAARQAGSASGGKVTNIIQAPGHTCINGLAFDAAGDIYYSDCDVIRKISLKSGESSVVAGKWDVQKGSQIGYSGDGGPATEALLNQPGPLVADRAGNLYIADNRNHVIRRVDRVSGTISTFAGRHDGGTMYATGSGMKPTAVGLRTVTGLACDHDGNLYISEDYDHKLIKVPADGGTITVLGQMVNVMSAAISPIAMNSHDDIYFANIGDSVVKKISSKGGAVVNVAGSTSGEPSGDGGPAIGSTLRNPTSVAVDPSDNVYIADDSGQRIRMVDAKTGIISSVYTGAPNAGPNVLMGVDAAGSLYLIHPGSGTLVRVAR